MSNLSQTNETATHDHLDPMSDLARAERAERRRVAQEWAENDAELAERIKTFTGAMTQTSEAWIADAKACVKRSEEQRVAMAKYLARIDAEKPFTFGTAARMLLNQNLDAALNGMVSEKADALRLHVMNEDTLSEAEQHQGAPIRSLHDRSAYVALGRSRRRERGDDDETCAWAMEATVASVADTATEQDQSRILAWVREGESERG